MAKILIVTLSEGLTDWDVNKLVSKIEKMRGVESVEIEDDPPPVEENFSDEPGDEIEEIASTEPGVAVEPYVATGEVVIIANNDNRERVIYEWVDPDKGTPVYVGQTLDYTRRIADQWRNAKRPSLEKWLHLQFQLGKKPEVRQITKIKGKNAADRAECDRISELTTQGIVLINRTQGNIAVIDEVNVKFLK